MEGPPGQEVLHPHDEIHSKRNGDDLGQVGPEVRREELAATPGEDQGLEEDHRNAGCDAGNEEEHGQQRRVPEGVEPVRHDEVQRAEGGLVQGGEEHADDHQGQRDGVNPLDGPGDLELLEDDGGELE